MAKERPGELRHKINRLKVSRDTLKAHNREKAQNNKKLRDRNIEITTSRDHWKARCTELDVQIECQKEELEKQIQNAQEDAARQRMRAEEEKKRADALQDEIETVWKKKSRT